MHEDSSWRSIEPYCESKFEKTPGLLACREQLTESFGLSEHARSAPYYAAWNFFLYIKYKSARWPSACVRAVSGDRRAVSCARRAVPAALAGHRPPAGHRPGCDLRCATPCVIARGARARAVAWSNLSSPSWREWFASTSGPCHSMCDGPRSWRPARSIEPGDRASRQRSPGDAVVGGRPAGACSQTPCWVRSRCLGSIRGATAA